MLLVVKGDFILFADTTNSRTVKKGVGGVRVPGPAKASLNKKIDSSLGPGGMKHPGARTGSRRP